MIDLSGKTALVTGGSRGIGHAIVLRLARQGADVAFSFRGNQAAADATVAEVEALGRRGVAIQVDARDAEAADAMVKTVLEAFGRIDILVNNAGHRHRRCHRRVARHSCCPVILPRAPRRRPARDRHPAQYRRRSAMGESPKHQIRVGDRRLVATFRIAHRSRLGAGAARPDLEMTFAVIHAIEPPPVPIVLMSIIGIRTGNGPTDPPLVTCGLPPSIRQRSVEVPPAFSVTRSGKPATSAITAQPSAPAAGPESAVVIGFRTTWSALATPPLDCITRKGLSCRPRPNSWCTRLR